MVTICEKCGAKGDQKKLVFCMKCEDAAEHRYCLEKMPKEDEEANWTCYDCTPPEARQPPVVIPLTKSERIGSKKEVKLSRKVIQKKKSKTIPSILKEELRAYCRSPEGAMPPLLNTDIKAQNIKNEGAKAQKDTGRRKRFILLDEDSDEQYDSDKVEAEDEPSCDQISGNNELEGEEKRMALEGGKVYEKSELFEAELEALETGLIHKDGQGQDASKPAIVEAELEAREMGLIHKDGQGHDTSKLAEVEALKTGLIHKDGEGQDASKPAEAEAFHSVMDIYQGTLNKSCRLPYLEPEKYVPARPTDDPIWKGRFNVKSATGETTFGISAHVSTTASPNVDFATSRLPLSLDIRKTSRRPDSWPKSFEISPPTIDCIGIYLFPVSERDERIFDGLLTEMIDHDLALKETLSNNVELLVFSSFLLPPENRRLCGKYFLWGVYRTRKKY